MNIYPGMYKAIPIRFKKPLFDDDFVEPGMRAWVTSVEWTGHTYEIFMDFTDWEDPNYKYFKASYYPNRYTEALTGIPAREDSNRYTAIDANCYTAKYSCHFSLKSEQRDDNALDTELAEYFEVLEQDSHVDVNSQA